MVSLAHEIILRGRGVALSVLQPLPQTGHAMDAADFADIVNLAVKAGLRIFPLVVRYHPIQLTIHRSEDTHTHPRQTSSESSIR
jgi:hypothetical protein